MITQQIARRYAQGLLLSCQSSGLDTAQVVRDLDAFLRIVESNRAWEVFVNNPSVPKSTRERSLEKVLGDGKVEEVIRRFLLLLFRKGRFALIHRIVQTFKDLVDEAAGLRPTVITAARDLTPEEVKEITSALEKITGFRVKARLVKDPSIIGGFIARVGSLQFDGSLEGRLRWFTTALSQG